MIRLQGKPIAITGASSGIGLATAFACALAGMPVALGARRMDRLQNLVAEIEGRGGRALAVETDVTNPDDCRRLVERTIAAFGSIYAMFANAGVGLEKSLQDTSDAEMREIFEVNFYGTLNAIRPALEPMLAVREGHILVCSSCLSKLGIPYLSAYSATKAAQDHISRGMRAELSTRGIAVSSVHPVGTQTEFFGVAEARSGARRAKTPAAFEQSPERVARAIVRRLRNGRGGEVWTSLPAQVMFAAADLVPGLTDWCLDRFARRRERLVAERPSESGPLP
jgi:short-subunit dehydrogenase